MFHKVITKEKKRNKKRKVNSKKSKTRRDFLIKVDRRKSGPKIRSKYRSQFDEVRLETGRVSSLA